MGTLEDRLEDEEIDSLLPTPHSPLPTLNTHDTKFCFTAISCPLIAST